MWAGTRESKMMKTTLLAGVAAAILATSPAWVARPTLPGDRFQLAESGNGMPEHKAEGNGSERFPIIRTVRSIRSLGNWNTPPALPATIRTSASWVEQCGGWIEDTGMLVDRL